MGGNGLTRPATHFDNIEIQRYKPTGRAVMAGNEEALGQLLQTITTTVPHFRGYDSGDRNGQVVRRYFNYTSSSRLKVN